MNGGRGEYLVVQVLNVLLYRIDELRLVLLYRTTNLHECHSAEKSQWAKKACTFGLTKSALNFEKTLNISFALCALPSPSLSLAIPERHARCTRFQLFLRMPLPPLLQIPHPFHKSLMRRNNLYRRNKLLTPLPPDVGELVDEILPHVE